jgi:hypothetical protein
LQTVQLQGKATTETDIATKEFVFHALVKARPSQKGDRMPPITRLHNGSFIIFRIIPSHFSYSDYSE